MDTIPKAIANNPTFGGYLRDFLPGWKINRVYNFQLGAVTQKMAAQLGGLVQNGSHLWINNHIEALLCPEFKALEDPEKTRRLAALVNVMYEANGEAALASDGADTGGYVAYSSRSDPRLIKLFGRQPATSEMAALARKGLSWDDILGSKAGKAVLDGGPRRPSKPHAAINGRGGPATAAAAR